MFFLSFVHLSRVPPNRIGSYIFVSIAPYYSFKENHFFFFFLILWFLVAFVAVKVIHSHLNITQVELLKSYSKMFSWVRFPDPVEIGWLLEVIVHFLYYKIYCCCCRSVTKLSLTLCHTMGYNRPGFPVLHYLQEFAQTHVHWIGDAIQPSHLMSSPSLAFNLFQH